MRFRKKAVGVGFLLVAVAFLLPATVGQCLAASRYTARLTGDIQAIGASRAGMESVIRFIDEHPDVFLAGKPDKDQLPGREQRIVARHTWERFLDHIILLDSLGAMYSEIYKDARGKKKKAEPFSLSYAAFLAEYRFAMDFIERVEKNPAMHVLLNEPMAELGIAKGSYGVLKYRFLNVIRGAEFARLNVLYNYYGKSKNPLQDGIREDIDAIWQAGRGKGPALTARNGARIVADLGFTAWFPVQKGVSKLMGRTKVWRPGQTLITQQQIVELGKELEPGDILLERREWYATNVGIPGFWPHAALYIGTAEERRGFFANPEVGAWLSGEGAGDGNLDTLLASRYPAAYKKSNRPQEGGHLVRVIEAIEQGVSFTTLEHSAAADSLVVLRPRLPKTAKARAILRSFHYSGRPYDFNFDFRTDSELVCSELIYKAYEKTNSGPGLILPISEVLGRPLLSPNDIAQLFAEEYQHENRQFDFVYFLDGNEIKQQAFSADVETFLTSWQRPKWHIWVQNLGKDSAKSPSKP